MTRAGGRLGWHGPCKALQSLDPLHVRVCSETHVSRGAASNGWCVPHVAHRKYLR